MPIVVDAMSATTTPITTDPMKPVMQTTDDRGASMGAPRRRLARRGEGPIASRDHRGPRRHLVQVEPLTTARALRGPFDYLRPEGVDVGSVLVVPFGRATLVGVVTGLADGVRARAVAPRACPRRAPAARARRPRAVDGRPSTARRRRGRCRCCCRRRARAPRRPWAEAARAPTTVSASADRQRALLHRCRASPAAPRGAAAPGSARARDDRARASCAARRAPRRRRRSARSPR